MYPVSMVIYKGFFNSCQLFINGTVKWVGRFNIKGNDRMRAGRIKQHFNIPKGNKFPNLNMSVLSLE